MMPAVPLIAENAGVRTFYTDSQVVNLSDRKRSAIVPKLLVDTGNEAT